MKTNTISILFTKLNIMKSYEEIGFQAVWQHTIINIKGEKWYCYCAFPVDPYDNSNARLHLSKGTRHQETNVYGDFDIYKGEEWTAQKLTEEGKDISHLGNFSKR